mgnify:CR=1 FL=1
MAVRITGRVVLRVSDKVVESTALFDTGVTKSFVDLKLAKEVMLAVKESKA